MCRQVLFSFSFLKTAVLALSVGLSSQSPAQALSAATDGQRPADANPQNQIYAGPIRLFDNLYYIGTTFVSAYLLETSEGLIMIDSLYNEFTEQALDTIESMAGYSRDDIRYVLVTHGHNDHTGGAQLVKAASGATVAMSAADWELYGGDVDTVLGDGDTLTLGDTRIRFYLTPGHTTGVLSMQFTVRDGSNSHQAFLFGGHNVTSGDPDAFRQFIASVERLQEELVGIEVSLTSHPWASLIFERSELLESRSPGMPHPFVDGADFTAFLNERLDNARSRLAAIEQNQ